VLRRFRHEHRLDADGSRSDQDHHLRQGGGSLGHQARRLSDGEGERHREDDQDHRSAEQWAPSFEEKYIYQSPTGPLLPKVNIGGIEGGAPYRPNYFPGVCSIYVDIRMPPQVRPVAIKHELEQVLDRGGVEYEMDIYKSLLGHEGRNVEPLVHCAEAAYQHLFGEKIKPEPPTAPASGPTPTSTMNSAFRRSRSARAAAASVRATRRSTSTK